MAKSDEDKRIAELMHSAAACMNRGDRAGVLGALGKARELLAANRTGFLYPQPTIYKFQAADMAWIAGDAALALDFATLLLVDLIDKLQGLYEDYSESKDIERVFFANMYARAFIPFVETHPWVDPIWEASGQSSQQIGGPRSGSEFFDMLKDFGTDGRVRLDAGGWATWGYPRDQARDARYWSARVICDLGRVLLNQAKSGQSVEVAQKLAEKCLFLLKDLEDPKSQLLTSDAYSLLARALMRYGDARRVKERVINCFETSLRIQEQFGHPADAASDRSNLGSFHFELARFWAAEAEGAEQCARQAQADRKPRVRDRARELAQIKHAQAETAYQRAETLFQEVLPFSVSKDGPKSVQILNNLGALSAQRNDLAKAIRYFTDACEQAHRHGLTRSHLFVLARSQLGAVQSKTGNLAEAERTLREVIDLLDQPDAPVVDPEAEVKVRAYYGETLRRLGRNEDAYHYLSTSVSQIDLYRQTFLGLITGIGLLKSYRWIIEALIDCCVTLGEQMPERNSQAFELVETIKWRLFTSIVRFSPLRFHGPDPGPLLDQEYDLMLLVGNTLISQADQAAGNARVASALRQLEEVWRQLEPLDPEYVAIRREQTIKVDEVVSLLDDHVPTLVEYFIGEHVDDLALAFVIRRDESAVQVVRLPRKPSEIADDIDLLREANEDQPMVKFDEPARRLHQALIEPILSWLPEEAGVCLVPTGNLHNIPFSALKDGRRYLIERNPVVVVPSATALRWLVRRNSRTPRRCFIFTATEHITVDRARAADLAGFTMLARRKLKTLFPDSVLVPPREATKARLLEALAEDVEESSADVFHIACHGIFDYEGPDALLTSGGLNARLVLAGPADAQDKDLTAREIFVYVRPSATLVTLCACESGVAATSTNDDIVGLAHGFLFGGAASVLASLWYVVQGAGVDFTQHFYTSWMGRGNGQGPTTKIEAFRLAQRHAMRKPFLCGLFERQAHPYLWSAFQLLGDWR